MDELRDEIDLSAWSVERVDDGFAERCLARLNDDELDRELTAMADQLLGESVPVSAEVTAGRGERGHRRRWLVAGSAFAAAAAVLLSMRPEPSPEVPVPTPDAAVVMVPAAVDIDPVAAAELDKEAIRRAVREQFVPKAKVCYDVLRQRKPGLEGRVTLRLGVVAQGDRGVVDRVTIDDSDFNDEAFESCLIDAMKSVIFDRPKGSGRVEIVYPVVFVAP